MKKFNFILIFLFFLCISATWFFAKEYTQECFFENFDLESDAISGIREVLDKQNTKPYFIKRRYEISNDKVCIKTKSHFSEYRKKPVYEEKVLNTDFVNPSEIDVKVEFVYKSSDKNHLTRINKKAQKTEPKSKKIAFRSLGMNSILKV